MRGLIPAVFYGPGIDSTTVSVSPDKLSKALTTPLGRNAVLRLQLADRQELAMVKDVEIHPVSRRPLHVDFYRVDPTKPVEVEVPFTTHGKPAGIAQGGKLRVVFRKLPVRAMPDQIPASIEVDVSHLELNQAITVKDLKLGDGVQVTLPSTRSLALVGAEEKAAPEEETPVAGAAAAAGAAPAAAAGKPAAGKAAAKPAAGKAGGK